MAQQRTHTQYFHTERSLVHTENFHVFLHSLSSVLQLVQVFLVKGRFNEGKRVRQKLVSCNDNDRDVDQL